ncbi:aminotransferase class I/II-fold pyridoxal phosphate-dependent enzyme [Aureitalea sp. L0-47]|uniref:methionine aminotransferase n=1 Tax=Aureitalea sp. L0-47 TaxID=2816962 RepID=UPI002237B79C|nr:methionine aminotransferase [Aureitalea sp. L0-47]MCW5518339.1 aminotransferase class I/II-fold pyridoxal phosphate-dependent enzyme [Aureitalea sp. L0-47]
MISKLPNVTTTIFAVMSKMAQEYNAINISQGYPNFESDPLLIQMVNEAMKSGFNQYAPMPGDPLLRELIVDKMNQAYGSSYEAQTDITITAGATQAIFTAIAATVHHGDEVIVFSPAYDCYEPAVELFGGTPRAIQLSSPDFKPDWDEVAETINDKTKLIIINSPHNPSGTLLDKADMEALERIVVDNDLYVISDEVYEHIIFDGEEHQSAARYPSLAERTFITASFGKTFHNTGWKLGYCVAPSVLMTEFRKVHQYNVFSVNHPIQKALSEYISNPETYGGLGAFYQGKRDLFLDLISSSRFKFKPSKGTYFQLLDYSEISDLGDLEFTRWLTQEKGLATIPTSVFNRSGADFKQVRVCFAKTDETLKAAAEIINSL